MFKAWQLDKFATFSQVPILNNLKNINTHFFYLVI